MTPGPCSEHICLTFILNRFMKFLCLAPHALPVHLPQDIHLPVVWPTHPVLLTAWYSPFHFPIPSVSEVPTTSQIKAWFTGRRPSSWCQKAGLVLATAVTFIPCAHVSHLSQSAMVTNLGDLSCLQWHRSFLTLFYTWKNKDHSS